MLHLENEWTKLDGGGGVETVLARLNLNLPNFI